MEGGAEPIEGLTFGRFRFDAKNASLWFGAERVLLRARSLDILRILAAANGNLVTKDELIARVWRGTIVEENALQVHVSVLRKALGESVGTQRHIVTVPGHGYRFVREPVMHSGTHFDPAGPLPDRPSIAVLRFQNMCGDPAQDYFIDGVAEDIITALARVPALFVIARTSSFAYGREPADVRAVGRALGARYVLEGSIRKIGNELRITGQLIQAETGTHLWAEHFDGNVADVFRFQDELITKAVGALLPSLRIAEEQRVQRRTPESLDSYELYLRGLVVRRGQTREENTEAIQLLERALELDPRFAAAAATLGSTWALRIANGWSSDTRDQLKVLRNHCLAVQLDPNGAVYLAASARMIGLFGENEGEVRALAEHALALSPNAPDVLRNCGHAFIHMVAAQQGLECLRRGLDISPRDVLAFDAWFGAALALIQLGRDREALEAARKAANGPRRSVTYRVLPASLALVGRLDEARDAVRELLAMDPQCTVANMAARYGKLYRRSSARFLEGLRLAGLPEGAQRRAQA